MKNRFGSSKKSSARMMCGWSISRRIATSASVTLSIRVLPVLSTILTATAGAAGSTFENARTTTPKPPRPSSARGPLSRKYTSSNIRGASPASKRHNNVHLSLDFLRARLASPPSSGLHPPNSVPNSGRPHHSFAPASGSADAWTITRDAGRQPGPLGERCLQHRRRLGARAAGGSSVVQLRVSMTPFRHTVVAFSLRVDAVALALLLAVIV